MAFKMLLLAFSVLLIARVTLATIDCENFAICGRPNWANEVPGEISDFNDYCVTMKPYLRCLKEWQDECGTDRHVVFFQSPETSKATYDTLSEVCEEGTLLNTVAIQNLKCFNETFGRTRCFEEAEELVEPFLKRVREEEEFEYKLSVSCLKHTFVIDCVVSAISDNCGNLAKEAALDVIYRSRNLKDACLEMDAKSDLDTLDTFDLSEDKKRSASLLLEKLIEENGD